MGELPHVDDSVRITLPFAPIDRQLVKGQVEVSALRFVASLPEAFHKYFAAKMGVKVPIPLEEVFQNLPSPKHELASMAPVPSPKVLAPAPEKPALGAPVAPVISIPVPAVPEATPALAAAASLPSAPAALTQDAPAVPVPVSVPASESDVRPASATSAVPPPLPTVASPEAPAAVATIEAPSLTAAAANVPPAEIPSVPSLEQEKSTPEPVAEPAGHPATANTGANRWRAGNLRPVRRQSRRSWFSNGRYFVRSSSRLRPFLVLRRRLPLRRWSPPRLRNRLHSFPLLKRRWRR